MREHEGEKACPAEWAVLTSSQKPQSSDWHLFLASTTVAAVLEQHELSDTVVSSRPDKERRNPLLTT
jgi:hypothetical protein